MKATTLALALILTTSVMQAATVISYTATSDPSLSPDGTITFGGSGTANVWTVGGSGGGSFSGNSADNGDNNGGGAGSTAWALFSSTSLAREAVHSLLGGALSVGQQIELDFDNGFINNGGVVGVSLWNSSNQNLFEFFFTGGNSSYQKNDSGGVANTGMAFTDDGFKFRFSLNSATGYSALLGSTAISGNLINQSSQDITQVRVFSFNNPGPGSGDNDLFFNNLVIAPEPSRVLFCLLGLGAVVMRRRRFAL
jgi:hypothetical protein